MKSVRNRTACLRMFLVVPLAVSMIEASFAPAPSGDESQPGASQLLESIRAMGNGRFGAV
jgi:hypothetical protein